MLNLKKCPVCGSIGLPRRIRGIMCVHYFHVEKQPDPVPQPEKPHIVDLVKDDLDHRKQIGIKTYGVALTADNGRNALWDAYEEALDLCCYLRQAVEEQNAAQ